MLREKNKSIIISYIALRRLIGILGILLPFISILGGMLFSEILAQESISYYYYTNMRDFFVGLMFSVSMFLITYKGYERIDNIVTTLSGLAGIGIPLFPCLISSDSIQRVGIFQINPNISDKIHLACAALFFILLAINSIFLFTMSKCKSIDFSRNKKIRNAIYRICGIIILASLVALLIIFSVLDQEQIRELKIVLVLEIIMLIAFGTSWLIKGETLFRDQPEQFSNG